jgi:hypothetical protein
MKFAIVPVSTRIVAKTKEPLGCLSDAGTKNLLVVDWSDWMCMVAIGTSTIAQSALSYSYFLSKPLEGDGSTDFEKL